MYLKKTMTGVVDAKRRPTQAERSARSQGALLESAARGLSREGYGNLSLERVASDAGYTRGALYHQFANKEQLALAVVAWVEGAWYAEVGHRAQETQDPVAALLDMARGHAVFCRRDVARVMMTLKVEFSGRDHPIARALAAVGQRLIDDCARLIVTAREAKQIADDVPARTLAVAYMGALEGLVIGLSGKQPFDTQLAEWVVEGLLRLSPGRSAEVVPTPALPSDQRGRKALPRCQT